jgi:hypothetical protein
MGRDQSLKSESESIEGSPTGLPAAAILAVSTATYISQIAGELATLARNAEIHLLTYLLARAQIEAELWSHGVPARE